MRICQHNLSRLLFKGCRSCAVLIQGKHSQMKIQKSIVTQTLHSLNKRHRWNTVFIFQIIITNDNKYWNSSRRSSPLPSVNECRLLRQLTENGSDAWGSAKGLLSILENEHQRLRCNSWIHWQAQITLLRISKTLCSFPNYRWITLRCF